VCVLAQGVLALLMSRVRGCLEEVQMRIVEVGRVLTVGKMLGVSRMTCKKPVCRRWEVAQVVAVGNFVGCMCYC
jgi:hypothetical protein